MEYPINGSCQCGQLTYQLHEAPIVVVACHCTECQKLSTSPFSVSAIVTTNAIEFSGELSEWNRSSDSGNRNRAKFCPGCGNRVYHINPDDPSTLRLKLKPVNMTDASVFEPTVHCWVSEKLDWVRIPDGTKLFDKQP